VPAEHGNPPQRPFMEKLAVKIGISVFLTEQSGNAGEAAREAEDLGFESFWVPEHLVIPTTYTTHYPRSPDGKVPPFYAHLVDSFVALATAAQATRSIRLGTGVCLLVERNVIETAKASATLDRYSNGRLIFGVGAGWFPEEAGIMGVNFRRRWAHLRESVEALRDLWSREESSYQGEFIKFPPVRLFPKPVQKPYPPIVLGAHDPKYALKRVAAYADGWCPGNLAPDQMREAIPLVKRLAKEAGRDPENLEFSVMLWAEGDGSSPDAMKRYREAGVSRIVLMATQTASGNAVEVVKSLAPAVERGHKV
jgi:probable F420-dependent oxidoreductase